MIANKAWPSEGDLDVRPDRLDGGQPTLAKRSAHQKYPQSQPTHEEENVEADQETDCAQRPTRSAS